LEEINEILFGGVANGNKTIHKPESILQKIFKIKDPSGGLPPGKKKGNKVVNGHNDPGIGTKKKWRSHCGTMNQIEI
ncbi:MAG: hypothetical protein OXI23_02605, partial [Gemmatimonadota bacterium]|nr:hypothetical protein [Gemmatimonadota bacterium]